MSVGFYARASTSDKDQGPETLLVPLQEYVQLRGGWCLRNIDLSRCQAAQELSVGYATFKRLLDAQNDVVREDGV